MLLNDRWIKEQAGRGMISPFVPEQVSEGGDQLRPLQLWV
jgi:deoxycytidine triphosphate deaminase